MYEVTNAQAEIARLQAEVERLGEEMAKWSMIARAVSVQRDTAWNDAIEAAYKCADQDASAYHIRQDISTLKREVS